MERRIITPNTVQEQEDTTSGFEIESPLWRGLFLLSMLIGVLLFAYQVRSVLTPLLLAFGIAYVLNPLVGLLVKNAGLPRSVSVSVLFIVFFGVLLSSIILITPILQAQTRLLYQHSLVGDQFVDKNNNGTFDPGTDTLENDLDNDGEYDPPYLDQLISWGTTKFEKLQQQHPHLFSVPADLREQIETRIRENIRSIGESAFDVGWSVAGIVGTSMSALTGLLSYLLLLPLYTFFFLLEMNNIWDGLVSHFPEQRKKPLMQMFQRIHDSLGSFFRGQLLICLAKGVLTGVLLTVLGVPFSILLGLLSFLGSIVPFLVNIISFLPALLIVFTHFGFNWGMLLGVSASYIAVEILEGTVLYPLIMGKETGIHPLIVVVSLLIGGHLSGVFGMLLAIPAVLTIGILADELVLPNLVDQGQTSSDKPGNDAPAEPQKSDEEDPKPDNDSGEGNNK